MTNDLFGGLGGLMKGLSSFMPQDDPNVKLMKAQSELNDLQNQEIGLYAEIGKQSLLRNGGQFPELESRLKLVQANLTEAQARLEAVQAEKTKKEQEEQQAEEREKAANATRHINLNELDGLSGLMTEEETLVAKMMAEQGNSVDFTA